MCDDEHDDDLTSDVAGDAEQETEGFPVTDELEDEDEGNRRENEPSLDEDESEL